MNLSYTLLRRYPNRRLYDTRTSRYVTLEELAARIRQGEDFKVIDSESEADLTHATYLHVVLAELPMVVDLLPLEFLKLLIRLRDERHRGLFGAYLKMMMESFALAQRQAEEGLRQVQEQMAATLQLMRSFFPFVPPSAPPPPPHEEEAPGAPSQGVFPRRKRGRPKRQ